MSFSYFCLAGLLQIFLLVTCDAAVPVVDCAALGPASVTEKYFMQSSAIVLQNIDEEFVERGAEYLGSQLLQNKAYIRLSRGNRDYAFVDYLGRNGSWFLPVSLECVRQHLVFVGFYMLDAVSSAGVHTHCLVDKVHCLVEGEFEVTVNPGSTGVEVVTLSKGECLFIPRGLVATLDGAGLLGTWLWTPLVTEKFNPHICSSSVRSRQKYLKRMQQCQMNPRIPRPEVDLLLAGTSAREQIVLFLSRVACPSARDADELREAVEAAFPSVKYDSKLESSAQQFVASLALPAEESVCATAEFITAARQLAQEFVSSGLNQSTELLPPGTICTVAVPGTEAPIVYARDGETGLLSDGRSQAVSFAEQNPASGQVTLRDGPMSPEVFITDFVMEARPVVLKGIFRKQPAFMTWRDQYIVKKLAQHGVTSQEQLNISYLVYGHDPPLNGIVPGPLWEDLSLPPVLCDSSIRQRLVQTRIVASRKSEQPQHVDGLKYEMSDQLLCLLDGYANVVLCSTEYTYAVPVERGSRMCDVNLDNVNVDKYGVLLDLPWISAAVEPGDCLYLPSRWSHAISYHKRLIAIDFMWNALAEAPATFDHAPRCVFDGTATNVELSRWNLLQRMNRSALALDDIAAMLVADGEVSRESAAQRLLESTDLDDDFMLSYSEVLHMDHSLVPLALTASDSDQGTAAANGEGLDLSNSAISDHDEL